MEQHRQIDSSGQAADVASVARDLESSADIRVQLAEALVTSGDLLVASKLLARAAHLRNLAILIRPE